MAKKGLIYALLSALLFSTMNVFVKLLRDKYSTWGRSLFARGFLLGTVAVLIIMYVKGIRFSKEDRGAPRHAWLIRRFGMVCNFIALVHIKLSDATILFQTTGILFLSFSALFLKESIPKGAGKWLGVILIAVLVMVNPF